MAGWSTPDGERGPTSPGEDGLGARPLGSPHRCADGGKDYADDRAGAGWRAWALLVVAMGGFGRSLLDGQLRQRAAYQAYGPAQARTLAVFLHGDVSAGGPADYMYSYARSFASGRRDVAAVGDLAARLLRRARAGNRLKRLGQCRRVTFDAGSIRHHCRRYSRTSRRSWGASVSSLWVIPRGRGSRGHRWKRRWTAQRPWSSYPVPVMSLPGARPWR